MFNTTQKQPSLNPGKQAVVPVRQTSVTSGKPAQPPKQPVQWGHDGHAVVGPAVKHNPLHMGRPKAAATGIERMGTSNTTCCCGCFSLRVGVRCVAFITVLEGLCGLLVFLDDFSSSENAVFRWGSPDIEMKLQAMNGVMGFLAMVSGFLGIFATVTTQQKSMKPAKIANFRRYQEINFIWTIVWFMVVLLPTYIDRVDVPIGPGKFSPTRNIINPEFPNGKPHVCKDVLDIKMRFVEKLQEKMKNPMVKRMLSKKLEKVAMKILPCKAVVKLFYVWMAICLMIRGYTLFLSDYLYRAVMRGGNGDYVYGTFMELYTPVGDREHTMALFKSKIKAAFDEMDKDGDGKLSLNELLGCIEGMSQNETLHAEAQKGKTA